MANAVMRLIDRMLYGNIAPYRGRDAALTVRTPATPGESRSSLAYDTHIVTEAAGGGVRPSTPKSLSLAYDDSYGWSQESIHRTFMGLTPRERKDTLLAIFLANPWASNCIDTIALYIISGGMTIEPRVPNPDKSQRKKIEELLLRINEDWDFNQYVYDLLTDDMIFGEAFTEYTMRDGAPYQLFSIDCVTMDTEHDRYGRVVRYKQQLELTNKVNYLDKNTIIRWWNPHKRAKVDPFSPLERVQDAILLDKKMVNWMTTFFQKGAKFPYYIEGGENFTAEDAERYRTFFQQNYTGEKNAHVPPITWGGSKLTPNGKGALDIDFNTGLDRMQTIVLSAFHVPPSIACIAESGNRLTDMSDGQRKILQYIACDPRRHRFFEKFNYRLIFPYFGDDYYVTTRYADFRSDKDLAEVADIRVKNGTLTQNEVRQETGKEAYKKGGDVPFVWSTKEIVPVPRLDALEDEQTTNAKLDIEAKQVANKKAKEPPPPPVMPGVPGAAAVPAQKAAPAKVAQPAKKQAKESVTQGLEDLIRLLQRQTKEEHATTEAGQDHSTGMMLAFMLDPETAKQLALPGGESADQLHITLAYLGDMEDDRTTDYHYPDRDLFWITRILTSIALDTAPLTGIVGGVGRFFPAETEKTPVIALVDAPGLVEFRTKLVDALKSAYFYIADDHGYTPHITLSYIAADKPMPIESVPPLPLTFDTVWLCVGGERTPFKLLGIPDAPVQSESAGDAQQQSDDSDKLALSLAALWLVMTTRGAEQLGAVGAILAYRFTNDEENQMTDLLADAYVASRIAAYIAAFRAIGLSIDITSTEADIALARPWAAEQVASITKTFEDAFMGQVHGGAIPDATAASDWINHYTSWKAPQIAQYTTSVAANTGTRAATTDILDAATGGTTDINGLADLLDSVGADNIRIRVVPSESSGDECAQYAGNDYSLDESGDIMYFPAHNGCIHSIEVYLVDDTLSTPDDLLDGDEII